MLALYKVFQILGLPIQDSTFLEAFCFFLVRVSLNSIQTKGLDVGSPWMQQIADSRCICFCSEVFAESLQFDAAMMCAEAGYLAALGLTWQSLFPYSSLACTKRY